MKTKRKLKRFLWLITVAFIVLFSCFESMFSVPVKADDTANSNKYTPVMEDLLKDENFDRNAYPAVADDYSLKIIQIAESSDKELFIYVYQPSHDTKDLTATAVNMSTVVSPYNIYNLTLVSTYGVFDKYKVEDLTVLDDPVRYYSIASIFRVFDETIDDYRNVNTVGEDEQKAFSVAQRWVVYKQDGVTTYDMVRNEVVTITNKIVGHIEYPEGFKLYTDCCHSHFVAFTADRNIEKLIAARVYYGTREKTWQYTMWNGETTTYDPALEYVATPHTVYITYTDTAQNDGDGFLGKKYTWNRIEKTSDFLANEDTEHLNINSGTIADLESMQWILRFVETDYTSTSSGYVTTNYSTVVSDVSILQLTFETDGKVYDLGVVDNMTTGSEDPVGVADTKLDIILDNIGDMFKDFWDQFVEIIKWVFIVILGAVILFTCAPWLLVFLGKLCGWILKGALWIIKLPFKGLAWIGKLFKKKKSAPAHK